MSGNAVINNGVYGIAVDCPSSVVANTVTGSGISNINSFGSDELRVVPKMLRHRLLPTLGERHRLLDCSCATGVTPKEHAIKDVSVHRFARFLQIVVVSHENREQWLKSTVNRQT